MKHWLQRKVSQKSLVRWRKALRAPLALLVLSIASATSAKKSSEDLNTISDRVGQKVISYQGNTPQNVLDRSAAILEEPLTVETAVDVALLRSRKVQGLLAQIGLSKAEHRGESLPANPEFELGWTGGESRGLSEIRALQNVNDLLLFPLKRRRASDNIRRDKLAVAHELLSLITETKKAFYNLQSSIRVNQLLAKQLNSIESAAILMRRQKKAGNINTLELSVHEVDLADVQLTHARSKSDNLIARAHFEQMLGIGGESQTWEIYLSPADIPAADIDGSRALDIALANRMDLMAAHAGFKAAGKDLSLARWNVIPDIHLGALVEQEDGNRRIGPAVEVELPLFNFGLSKVKRARILRDQSRHNIAALEAVIQSDVKEAILSMEESRKRAASLEDVIIPARTLIVRESQKHYNYMLIGVYDLLRAKREKFSAERDHVEAVRDYWLARSDLERAVGGNLPPGEKKLPDVSPQKIKSMDENQEDKGEHHHDHE